MARVDLSVRVHQGAFVLDAAIACDTGVLALYGPSGSGKTSILEVIAGIRRPHAGRIAFGQEVFLDTSQGIDLPIRGRRVGYVPQDALLFPHLSVQGNVMYGVPPGGTPELATLSERLGIAHLMGRPVGKLSGGERQRVALLRALAAQPRVLLLDEPLSALDDEMRRRVLDVLIDWRRERAVPLVYVTHSRDEVSAIADHVAVLQDGRVVALGAPADVMAGRI